MGSTRKPRGAGKTAKNREKRGEQSRTPKQRMRKAEGMQRQSLKVYRVEEGEAQQEQRAKSKKERTSVRQKLKAGAIPKLEGDKAPAGRKHDADADKPKHKKKTKARKKQRAGKKERAAKKK